MKNMTKAQQVRKEIKNILEENGQSMYSTSESLEWDLRHRGLRTSIATVRAGLADLVKKREVHRHREGRKVYYMSLRGWREVEKEIAQNRRR